MRRIRPPAPAQAPVLESIERIAHLRLGFVSLGPLSLLVSTQAVWIALRASVEDVCVFCIFRGRDLEGLGLHSISLLDSAGGGTDTFVVAFILILLVL